MWVGTSTTTATSSCQSKVQLSEFLLPTAGYERVDCDCGILQPGAIVNFGRFTSVIGFGHYAYQQISSNSSIVYQEPEELFHSPHV